MSNKTLATFRIGEDDWNAFKQWAESKGSNASSELVKYALTCIGKIESDNPLPNLDKNINSYLDANLGERIDKRIEEKLANCIDIYLDTNDEIKDEVNSAIINKTKTLEAVISDRLLAETKSAIAPKLEKVESSLDQKIKSAVASLREELQPLLTAEKEMQQLANNDELITAIANEVKK